jgi:hypothetical protein
VLLLCDFVCLWCVILSCVCFIAVSFVFLGGESKEVRGDNR